MEKTQSNFREIGSAQAQTQHIARGQTLVLAGAPGRVWRVQQGAFRLVRPVRDGHAVVDLAVADDLIGVEALCAQVAACTVTAVLDSVVVAEPVADAASHTQLLAAAFMQQQRQALEMAHLRSGAVTHRIGYLRQLLSRTPGGQLVALERNALPLLKDMAQIIDSCTETVCREINRQMPARTPRKAAPAYSAWRGVVAPFAQPMGAAA